MIGIVDSGSTKADFIFIDKNGNEILRTETIGFNPIFINSAEIEIALKRNSKILNLIQEVTEIHFFGAGCRSVELNNIVKKGFNAVFKNANCYVDSDLVAACYALYEGKPTIVGILGTGSNSCYYDGEELFKENPSIGFILGDEGAGNHIGRDLIKAFYAKKLPKEISIKFKERYPLSIQEMLDNVYRRPNPNTYLAKFNEFAFEHRNNEFMRDLIKSCFRDYFHFQVEPYEAFDCKEISFVGSIAFYYQDLLLEVAAEFGYNINKFVQKPIDGLVDYYSKYI